ncbi:Zn(2)-C6 fungal-type DNA-binding domain protein [Niveomyces insectorum RCEF 264]|uniref:Zn(2)-C6 fungal-type DNA-binding domain protein n=1 Tax=Niveomyces insectorum RCEF 264 TaxID=1081102 RepID=A0A167SE28_9HYPO|nr:Zn(2)-C6 fungal-type DNA-binding domain protein [Niveomyces insectorum RCEF 264]
MSPELDPAPKRTRESTSKVRTGCRTCKGRRVKCDEAKPVCRRCAVGGRTCEYGLACAGPRRRLRDVITVYLPPAQSQPVVFAHDRGLDFFHQRLAAELDGRFDDATFWSRLVLQLSHAEASVRHAVAAISATYQDVEASLRHPAGYVDANPEAQRAWNAAVKSLAARIQAHPHAYLVPLVCCLLFTCIEFLRGNIESAMLHVESGFNILAPLRCTTSHGDAAVMDDDAGKPRLSAHDDLGAVEEHIVPMFSRLRMLCSLARRWTPPLHGPPAREREDAPLDDLVDARRRLFEISDDCIRFIDVAIAKAAAFQIGLDDLVEQAKRQTRLDAWRDQLDALLQRMPAAEAAGGNPAKQDALHLLLVHYKVLYIWLRVCTTVAETATDAYHADFDELVRHAEHVVKKTPGVDGAPAAPQPQPLSLEVHVLGPLYYAALKCRQPAIRRRALDLLQWAPRREGLWNAHHAYVTARRVIELEERHLGGPDELPDETLRLHGLPLPDDESRVYHPDETPFDVQQLDHSIVLSPAYPGTLAIEFRTKPWGLLGAWQIVTEYIKP